ncbi:hypothetical protein [Methylovirgula sp. HY1]|uniref:hypothetical protein n=1 Tax=Methylovirgula sp. HY1 TaxID=2822761 RepID=UPI001C5AD2C0|nr:hypothetical protein [Methylovirgula sp. HY1]QXX75714.1 hypothetical protein MHY1_02544 [Methylovirgula sp. HY1]
MATIPGRDVAASSGRAPSGVDLALFSGGDERVFLNPVTGRTKYGTPHGCAEDEAWFSSSTGTAISARGYAAAVAAWQKFFAGSQTLEEGFDEIRQKLTQIFGIEGTQAVLAGSGTEAVLISLALARMVCRASVTAIIVGCAETGRGVSAAAAGLHFVRQAAFAAVIPGDRLAGFETMDINVDTVAIRDRGGALRPPGEVDAELAQKAETARRAGRDVIIHRLEASKTGHSAPSLAVLDQLCKAAPGQILVLADACQLRCSAAHVQSLLQRGYLVSLTGSKFAGGPPFAGALLVPPAVMQRLRPMPLPAGLAAYSAQLDWPPMLRPMLSPGLLPLANIGLALRWQAALAEIERFFLCPADLRRSIFAHFRQEVAQRVAATSCLDLLPPPPESAESWGHSILCIAMRHTDGRCLDMAEAAVVQRRLREGLDAGMGAAKRFHLGQPVAVGGAAALRVCASAALVNRVADAVAAGLSFVAALAPVSEDLADLFTAWPAAVMAAAAVSAKIEAP